MWLNGWKQRKVFIAALCVILAAFYGCSKKEQQKAIKTQPADVSPTQPSPPAMTPTSRPVAASLPSSSPAETRPASAKPPSTYSSAPPYPVKLYVLDPAEKQPGWLKIIEMADADTLATAEGSFPERNRIYVNTQNVRQISIHIGHLPLAERKRIILQIDDQGKELTRKHREFVMLERRPTGEWVVLDPENK